jgi:hypothetical protein
MITIGVVLVLVALALLGVGVLLLMYLDGYWTPEAALQRAIVRAEIRKMRQGKNR